MRRGTIDVASLIDAQIAAVSAKPQALAQTRRLLLAVKSRVVRSEPIDVATFCSLIKHGDIEMIDKPQAFKQVPNRYMSDDAKADFALKLPALSAGFDQDDSEKWKDLGTRAKAALPLDPTDDAALALVRE